MRTVGRVLKRDEEWQETVPSHHPPEKLQAGGKGNGRATVLAVAFGSGGRPGRLGWLPDGTPPNDR